jgi:RNA polymerase II-associated factor 1
MTWQVHEAYQDKWEIIKVTHVPMSKDEEDERAEALAEVMDPMFLRGVGDVDADGEADAESVGGEGGGMQVDGPEGAVDVL